MGSLSRDQIRTVVVSGFLLSALAGVIVFVNDVTSLGFPFTFRSVLDNLVQPLSTFAAAGAWYLLTQVQVHDETQLALLRRAYLFFAAQYLLVVVGYNFIFTPPHVFGDFWVTSELWVALFGAVVTTFGLFMMYRSLDTSEVMEQTGVS